MITAVETTSGSIAENKKLMALVQARHENGGSVRTVVADHKYGTAENFVACHQEGVVTHLGDAKAKRQGRGYLSESRFEYQAKGTSIFVRRPGALHGGATFGGRGSGSMQQTKRFAPMCFACPMHPLSNRAQRHPA